MGQHIEGAAPNQLVVEEPFASMVTVLETIAREKRSEPTGIHPQAIVDEGVELGDDVTIGAGAVVRSGAVIGDRTKIYSNVSTDMPAPPFSRVEDGCTLPLRDRDLLQRVHSHRRFVERHEAISDEHRIQ